ncbi:MAG: electron transfer flavoprotein subunit alpha/FixB family protein [Thermoleophilia bacterium]
MIRRGPVWALVWLQEGRGEVTPESWGAARLAARLSEGRGIVGVVLAGDDEPRPDPPEMCGLTNLVVLRHPILHPYARESHAATFDEFWTRTGADLFLTPATPDGREIAVDLALRRQLPCATNVISLAREGEQLVACQPLPAGTYMAPIPLPGGRGCVALAPEVLERTTVASERTPVTDPLGLDFPVASYHVPPVPAIVPRPFSGQARSEVSPVECAVSRIEEERLSVEPPGWKSERILPADPETVDLSEADVVITAGYGIGSQPDTDALQALGHELGAALGVTRPVVDEGWAPFDRQIGQTGRYLKARAYLGFGVSGAVHHTAAIAECDLVIAVNLDPTAPIFTVSDVGFVADVHEVVPALRAELARRRAERGSGDDAPILPDEVTP